MKLSFSTLSFDEYSFEDLAKICKKYGYDGIEIRMGSGVGVLTYTPEELAEYKKTLDSYGVSVVGLGTSVCIRDYSDELLESFKNHLPMAKALGVNGLRVFMGTFKGYRSQPNQPMSYDGCVKFLQAACDAAAEYGVDLYIETHNEFATGKELKRLTGDVARENCKVIWDIMHPLEEDEAPEQTLELLGKLAAHVHIKDGTTDPDPDAISYIYCPIGEGEMPIAEIVEKLNNFGYDGYYSLEWEENWRQSLKELSLSHEAVLAHYAEYMKKIDAQIKEAQACTNA